MKLDLINQKFGKLVVKNKKKRNKHRCILWLCECECGNKTIVSSQDLRSGNTKSCDYATM